MSLYLLNLKLISELKLNNITLFNMKKIVFILCSVPTLAFSQITVTHTDMAVANDHVIISSSNAKNLNFNATGANFTWDFSTLVPASQTIDTFIAPSQMSLLTQIQFGSFAPASYKATYFQKVTNLPLDQLTMLPVTIDKIFQYSRLTADSMTSIGYSISVSGSEVPFRSAKIEKNYNFPIQYGNTTFSKGYTKFDINPIYNAILIQRREHASTVDGWGSIVTPYGTFNALRIKHEINEIDSIMITSAGVSTWYPVPIPLKKEYEWWTNGEKEPILKIFTYDLNGLETISAVEYRDIDRNLGALIALDEDDNFKIYPNPVENVLAIHSNFTMKDVQIVNVEGEIISQYDTNVSSLDVSELQSGIYFLKVTTENGVVVKLFQKK